MRVWWTTLKINIFILWLSLNWIGEKNLGGKVRYQGKIWMLSQGVRNPWWNLIRTGEYLENVHCRDFKLVQNPVEWINAFKSGWRFYTRNWRSIWISSDLKGERLWVIDTILPDRLKPKHD